MKLFGVTFAAYENLVFLPVLAILIIFLIWRFLKTKNIINKLSSASKINLLFKNYSGVKSIIKLVLLIIAVIFMFVALLRPQWDKREEVVEQKGRDLFIAVDISRSMLAQDCKPNRLEFAKQKIKKLVSNLKAERVCLIVFSGASIVQCPLTADYGAFSMFLDQLDVQTISGGTTALDQPIGQVLSILDEQKNKKTKLLVIFTDGEDFSGNLVSVREKAAKLGLKIFTMGVGSEQGAPIPAYAKGPCIPSFRGTEGMPGKLNEIQGHIKDSSGNVVISKLNEGILRVLASETGGRYFKLTESDNDLRALIADVEGFEKESFEEKKLPALQDRYNYFLLVSLVCLVIEWIL